MLVPGRYLGASGHVQVCRRQKYNLQKRECEELTLILTSSLNLTSHVLLLHSLIN